MYTMKLHTDYCTLSHLRTSRASDGDKSMKRPGSRDWAALHRSIKLHPGVNSLRKIPPLPYYSPYFPEIKTQSHGQRLVSFYPPYRARDPHPFSPELSLYLKGTHTSITRSPSDPGHPKPAVPRRRNQHLERRYSFSGFGRQFSCGCCAADTPAQNTNVSRAPNCYKHGTPVQNPDPSRATNIYKDSTLVQTTNLPRATRYKDSTLVQPTTPPRATNSYEDSTKNITSKAAVSNTNDGAFDTPSRTALSTTKIKHTPANSNASTVAGVTRPNTHKKHVTWSMDSETTLVLDEDDSLYQAQPIYAMLPGPQPQKRMPWEQSTGTELNFDLTPLNPKISWSDEDYGMAPKRESRRRRLVDRTINKVNRALERVFCIPPRS